MPLEECVEKTPTTVLSTLFECLEQIEMTYCVVGCTDGLPDEVVGDVDIVIDANSTHDFHRFMFEFSRENRLKLVQVLKHEQTANYFVLAWMDRDGRPRFLHPDVCTDYYRNGRIFLRADEVLSTRTPALDDAGKWKGFYVAAPAREFIYYLLKKVDKQVLDNDQGKHLSTLWAKAPVDCNTEIKRFWANENAELLRKASREDEWEYVRQKLSALQRSLQEKLFSNTLESTSREYFRILQRILLPTGLHVAFLGPDGSGKSSVIDSIIPDLAPAFRKTTYIHLRPGVGRKSSHSRPVIDPHGQPPRSWLASVVKVAYLCLDYVVGWWLYVWPKTVRSTLVVFDRYYHDLLIDPLRYRYGGPMWMARWISKLIPSPDLWILLDAPALWRKALASGGLISSS